MDAPSTAAVRRGLGQVVHRLGGLVWNRDQRRPRAPFRLLASGLLVLVLAGFGNQHRPRVLPGDGTVASTVNMLSSQVPNAVGLALAVVLAAVVLDRRRVVDLGLVLDRTWVRGLVGGTALGAGISVLAVLVGLWAGFYDLAGLGPATGPGGWVFVALGGALFQLLFIVPEELYVRGYLITNVVEGLDGVGPVSRRVAAGVGVLIASGFFYLTHSVKGPEFGLKAAVLSLLLGLGYVLSGDLSVPIGIHFGVNFAGVLTGTNPQPASLMTVRAASTVHESVLLPFDAIEVRLVGALAGMAIVLLWYRTTREGLRVHPALAEPLRRGRAAPDAGAE